MVMVDSTIVDWGYEPTYNSGAASYMYLLGKHETCPQLPTLLDSRCSLDPKSSEFMFYNRGW